MIAGDRTGWRIGNGTAYSVPDSGAPGMTARRTGTAWGRVSQDVPGEVRMAAPPGSHRARNRPGLEIVDTMVERARLAAVPETDATVRESGAGVPEIVTPGRPGTGPAFPAHRAGRKTAASPG